MSYKTLEAAKAANFPTRKNDADLSLEQVNKLAEFYDAIKAGSGTSDPMPVAWNAWLNVYKKSGDKWISATTAQNQEKFDTWIPIAKAEQTKSLKDGSKITLTRAALERSGASLTGGRVTINHRAMLPNLKMPQTKYEHPYLLMNADDKQILKLFRESDASGWSVELDELKTEGSKITDFNGGGISVLYFPHMPTCRPDMGCHETFETFIQPPHFEDQKQEQDKTEKSLISQLWAAIKDLAAIERKTTKKEDREYSTQNKIEMDKLEEVAAALAATKVELVTVKAEFEQSKTTNADTSSKLKDKTAEFEASQTTHTDELKTANAKIAEFEQKEASEKKAVLEAQWETLKKEHIPPGRTHKEEDEKKLHELFETDPHAFIMDLVGFDKTAKGTAEEGEEYNSEEAADTYMKTSAEFEGQLGGRK